jgi:tRNA U34 5-carboxymethylaminomethyl modifying enzyme MnmG/GidA
VTCEYFILAVARTKKQAKQQAAFKMLNRLKTSLANVLTVTSSDKGDASSEKVHTIIISTDYITYIYRICRVAETVNRKAQKLLVNYIHKSFLKKNQDLSFLT